MGYFDDILLGTTVKEDADRAALKALAEKYPDIRQSVDTTASNLDKWHVWKDENWDPQLGMTKGQAAAITEAEAAKLRVEALTNAGLGGDVPFKFEDIEADLVKHGYVKADQILANGSPVVDGINRSAANIEQFYKRTFTIPVEYMQEFGAAPPADLLDQMLTDYGQAVRVNPTANPRDSYNKIVAPKREVIRVETEAKNKAAHEKEVKDAEERAYARAKQELGMQSGSPGMPVDNGGAAPSMDARGNRVAMAEKSGDVKAAEILKMPLGSSAAAGLEWLQQQRSAAA
jgi:hypothetical protein